MRIDAADADARIRDPGARQREVRAANDPLHQRRVDTFDGIEQSHVRGHVDHAQFRRHQHHGDFGRTGQRRQQFGVARILVARGMQRFLAERRGADGLRLARLNDAHRALDVAERRLARDRRHLAEGKIRRNQAEIDAFDAATDELRVARVLARSPTCRRLATRWPASRRRSASPITSGLQKACTPGTASAFMMISGPMPAASPMVMAMVGSLIPFAFAHASSPRSVSGSFHRRTRPAWSRWAPAPCHASFPKPAPARSRQEA